jgi:hypothetical protein
MGGRSKSQTVGYRYSLGAHLALCHGPVDAIREIRVDDRIAWSIGTGQSTSQGTGVGALASYGTVTGMSASAAAEGDSVAELRFPGTLAGIRLGQSYDLQLLTDNTIRTVTVQAVSYNAGTGSTTWLVEPAATAFTAQSVAVSDAASVPSLNGGAAGGRIRINKPDLFGGEKREGGIVGDIDVLMGAPSQAQNDYLAANADPHRHGCFGLDVGIAHGGANRRCLASGRRDRRERPGAQRRPDRHLELHRVRHNPAARC